GTDAGHARERTTDADQSSDNHRRQLGVGFSRDYFLLVSVSLLRSSVLRCAVSWQLLPRTRISLTNNGRARVFRNTLGEFRDGLQARRSIRHLSGCGLSLVFWSVLPNTIIKRLRRPKTRQHLPHPPRHARPPGHPPSPPRRPRPLASNPTINHIARISNSSPTFFALGLQPRRPPRKTRRKFDPVLDRSFPAKVSALTWTGSVPLRGSGWVNHPNSKLMGFSNADDSPTAMPSWY